MTGAAGTAEGYWCELVACSPDAEAEWLLAVHGTACPGEAMDWLRCRARRLATVLAGTFPGRAFAEWCADAGYQAAQRAALAAGRRISVNAGGQEEAGGGGSVFVLYSLSCRRVRVPVRTPPGRAAPAGAASGRTAPGRGAPAGAAPLETAPPETARAGAAPTGAARAGEEGHIPVGLPS